VLDLWAFQILYVLDFFAFQILYLLPSSGDAQYRNILPFLTVAQHVLGTRKTISWSVTVYNKIFPVNVI
jgi:hypothetical protein